MIDFPVCKINLGLSVRNKRLDGFHEVETAMFPVPLNDALEIIPAKNNAFSFDITGLNISGDRKANLVVKAFELLKKDFNIPKVSIHLHKVIPAGAGLGGGSSDAASALKIFNEIFGLKLTVNQMEQYAGQLGSDCPFFIQNKTALATGKGNQVQIIDIDLEGYYIIIVKPNLHINTTHAYSWITPAEKEHRLIEIIQQPLHQWKEVLRNDFEPAIFQRYPEIRSIKKELYELGAVYASLSGSGAAVYGLFEKEPETGIRFTNHFIWKGKL